MRDITHKQISLRTAKAIGVIFCSPATIELIQKNELPKGNLFDVARAAAFLGAKATPQLLPHCHPVTIDGMEVEFEILNKDLHAELFNAFILEHTGIVIKGEENQSDARELKWKFSQVFLLQLWKYMICSSLSIQSWKLAQLNS